MSQQSSGPTTRSRLVPSEGARSKLIVDWRSTHPSDVPSHTQTVQSSVVRAAAYHGRQFTVSENHPSWRSRRNSRFSGDIGGEFYTEKISVEANLQRQKITRHRTIDQWRKQVSTYSGPILAVDSNSLSDSTNPVFGIPANTLTPNSVLDALGAEAIAAVKPTNSVADLSVFVGEFLREGLPSLMGLLHRTITNPSERDLSNGLLVIEFGIKPLVNDGLKFLKSVISLREVIDQYVADSGKIVRRRYDFPDQVSQSVTQLNTNWTARTGTVSSDLLTTTKGKLYRIDKTVRKRWFSGAFTYYLPDPDKAGGTAFYAALARKVYGANLDIETLWNLTPWSWAIDWFTNAGDVASNVSDMATDGLIMRWGYMMEHVIHTRTFYVAGPTGLWGNPPASPVTIRFEVKRRRKANPFGFGITMDGLSPRQIAILTALGISR